MDQALLEPLAGTYASSDSFEARIEVLQGALRLASSSSSPAGRRTGPGVTG